MRGIEAIDLSGTGDNSLTINAMELEALGGLMEGGKRKLIVEGNAGDEIVTTDSWRVNGMVDYEGEIYDLYEQGSFQLLVDRSISVVDSTLNERFEIRSAIIGSAIDGGLGFDVLVIVGDFDFDLTVIDDGLLRGIESIDLTGTGDNSLTINAMELEALGGLTEGGKTKLIVEGDEGDGIVSTDRWVGNGIAFYGRKVYHLYEQGDFQLLVDRDISTVGAIFDERIEIRRGDVSLAIDGGLGFDVLVFDGDFDLDLTSIGDDLISGMEAVDLTGSGGNSLVINAVELEAIGGFVEAGKRRLVVEGNLGDGVITNENWMANGIVDYEGETYRLYEQGNNQLLVSEVVAFVSIGMETVAGTEFDVLVLNGSGFELDLPSLSDGLFSGIELVDIRGGGDNILRVSSGEILALGGLMEGGKTKLIVRGDAGDGLVTADSWMANGTVDYGGETYNLYEQGIYQLLVDRAVDVEGIGVRLELRSGVISSVIEGDIGFDTLELLGDFDLDLTVLADNLLVNIEGIDLTGGGVGIDNKLTISASDIAGLGGLREDGKIKVFVEGDVGDSVELVGGVWAVRMIEYRGMDYKLFEQENHQLIVNPLVEVEELQHIHLGSDLAGVEMGFKILGEDAGDVSGYTVSSVGDVNGDGYDDLIIGAYGAEDEDEKTSQGISYVIFGKGSGFVDVDLGDLSEDVGFKIIGEDALDTSGYSVSGAGDVNGDGYEDLLVGASSAEEGNETTYELIAGRISVSEEGGKSSQGISYVIFGKGSGFVDVELGSLSLDDGFRILGEDEGDRSGAHLSGVGDVNGDGYADFIVGAFEAEEGSERDQGVSYVIFGKGDGFVDLDLGDLDIGDGFKIIGEDERDKSGVGVSGVGDVNGDGYEDLIVGAYWAEEISTESRGISYVIFGKSDGFRDVDLGNPSSFTSDVGFRVLGEDISGFSGVAVSGAGDVNGDGYDDFIIGAPYAEVDAVDRKDQGIVYVVYGKSGGFNDIDLGDVNSFTIDAGFKILGEDKRDLFGWEISGVGDVNGDGYDDLLVGAYLAEEGADRGQGISYVIYGKGSRLSNIDLRTDLSPEIGFKLVGEDADDRSGIDVSGGGDVNGDGYADLLVGAHWGEEDEGNSGVSYVIYGRDFLGDVLMDSGIFSGTSGADNLVGSNGADVIDTMGGADSVNSGAGDDVIKVIGVDFFRIDGGRGFDVLELTGAGLSLDLTMIGNSKIKDIESIDLTGTGDNSLTLNSLELRALGGLVEGGKTKLIVEGDGGDGLVTTDIWEENGVVDYGGESYNLYEQGSFQLLVDREINTRGAVIDDRIEIRSAIIGSAIDGGLGFDVLVIVGDFDLDLTVIDDGLLRGIEAIDLSGTGDNSLTINAMELEALGGLTEGGKTKLIVEGDDGDGLVTTDTWRARGTRYYEGEIYNLYQQGNYQLLVDRVINTRGAIINEVMPIRSGDIGSAIDGGLGFDTLLMDSLFKIDLDLTSIGDDLLSGIEVIDIRGGLFADNTLTINAMELDAIGGFVEAGKTRLIIKGNGGDTVITTDSWDANGMVDYEGASYKLYEQGNNQLLFSEAVTFITVSAETVASTTFDVLVIDGEFDLDLPSLSNSLFIGVEKIDITGSGDNILRINAVELEALGGLMEGGKRKLIIEGDAGDGLVTTDSWVANGTVDYGGEVYNLYEQGEYQLLVDMSIDVAGVGRRIEIRSGVISSAINGGVGFDTLALVGDFDLDLTVIGDDLLSGIEAIDLTGTGDNILTINFVELNALGGFMEGRKRKLIVEGNAGDSVLSTDSWLANSTVEYKGETYNLYEQGNNQLLVDRSVDVGVGRRLELGSGTVSTAINGGTGFDTLVLLGGFDLDLPAIGDDLLGGIEAIEFAGLGSNILKINAMELEAIGGFVEAGKTRLIIEASYSGANHCLMTTDIWVANGTVDYGGETYNLYEQGNYQLLVDREINTFMSIRTETVGGSDFDILVLDGEGFDLDLTSISDGFFSGLEGVDITGSGNNRLRINAVELEGIGGFVEGGKTRLVIEGDAGDLVMANDNWVANGTVDYGGRLIICTSRGSISCWLVWMFMWKQII